MCIYILHTHTYIYYTHTYIYTHTHIYIFMCIYILHTHINIYIYKIPPPLPIDTKSNIDRLHGLHWLSESIKWRRNSNLNVLLPACILRQLFFFPGGVSAPEVLGGCPLQALKKPTGNISRLPSYRGEERRQAWTFALPRYLNETLGEFSAGLARRGLDSHHRELGEKHQSGQERPGPPHGPTHQNQWWTAN